METTDTPQSPQRATGRGEDWQPGADKWDCYVVVEPRVREPGNDGSTLRAYLASDVRLPGEWTDAGRAGWHNLSSSTLGVVLTSVELAARMHPALRFDLEAVREGVTVRVVAVDPGRFPVEREAHVTDGSVLSQLVWLVEHHTTRV